MFVFLTEITLNRKNLHNLYHGQVRSNHDDDTFEINQQGYMKPIFNILHCWVLSHFTDDKQTNAWNSLVKHTTNSTSTETSKHQIKSVTNCHAKAKFYILCCWVLWYFAHNKLTNAWNWLAKHATNSTSTEMVNYHLQIYSVALCLTSDNVMQHIGIQTLLTKQSRDWGKW